jgi:hypothetical protein
VAHDRNAKRSALAWDRGRANEPDGVVLDDMAGITDALYLRVPLSELQRQSIFGGVKGDEFGPCCAHELDLPPDMRVVEADGGKSKRAFVTGHALEFPSATKPNVLAITVVRL